MPGGDFHPVFFVIVAAWILVAGIGVVAFHNIVHSAVSMIFCFLGLAFVEQNLRLEHLAFAGGQAHLDQVVGLLDVGAAHDLACGVAIASEHEERVTD